MQYAHVLVHLHAHQYTYRIKFRCWTDVYERHVLPNIMVIQITQRYCSMIVDLTTIPAYLRKHIVHAVVFAFDANIKHPDDGQPRCLTTDDDNIQNDNLTSFTRNVHHPFMKGLIRSPYHHASHWFTSSNECHTLATRRTSAFSSFLWNKLSALLSCSHSVIRIRGWNFFVK